MSRKVTLRECIVRPVTEGVSGFGELGGQSGFGGPFGAQF